MDNKEIKKGRTWRMTKVMEEKAILIPLQDPAFAEGGIIDFWDKAIKQRNEFNACVNQTIEFAKKDGFYGKNKKGNIKFHQLDHYVQDEVEPLLDLLVATDGAKFINIDYGRTWALTKEELE